MRATWGAVMVATAVLASQNALAKDFCFLANFNNEVLKSFTIPARGTCKPAAEISPDFAGFVSSGEVCTTSDGATMLFTFTDAFFSGVQSVQGSITIKTGEGTGENCLATG